MALKAALNGVRANFGTGGIRASVQRADKVLVCMYNLLLLVSLETFSFVFIDVSQQSIQY